VKDNFTACLAHVLKFEGGRSNDPQDPGGRTNKGITQATYDSYRDRKSLPRTDVFEIGADEVADCYRHDYWDKVRGDALRSGEDLAVFDYAVNSGPSRALHALTAANVPSTDAHSVIQGICASRLAFMRSLSTWPHFGAGWGKRVADVQRFSLEMAEGKAPKPRAPAGSKASGGVVVAGGAAAASAHWLGGAALWWTAGILILAGIIALVVLSAALAKRPAGAPKAQEPESVPAAVPIPVPLPGKVAPAYPELAALEASLAVLITARNGFEAAIAAVYHERTLIAERVKAVEAAGKAAEALLIEMGAMTAAPQEKPASAGPEAAKPAMTGAPILGTPTLIALPGTPA
jgi:lysozyme family protein